MRDRRIDTTANRSVVGIMNEFSYLADVYRLSAVRLTERRGQCVDRDTGQLRRRR